MVGVAGVEEPQATVSNEVPRKQKRRARVTNMRASLKHFRVLGEAAMPRAVAEKASHNGSPEHAAAMSLVSPFCRSLRLTVHEG